MLRITFRHRERPTLAIRLNLIVSECAAAVQILNSCTSKDFLCTRALVLFFQFLTALTAFFGLPGTPFINAAEFWLNARGNEFFQSLQCFPVPIMFFIATP